MHACTFAVLQYCPYNIPGGWTEAARESFAKRCFSLVDEYAPGFSSSVLHYEVLAPPDLERVFGLTGTLPHCDVMMQSVLLCHLQLTHVAAL